MSFSYENIVSKSFLGYQIRWNELIVIRSSNQKAYKADILYIQLENIIENWNNESISLKDFKDEFSNLKTLYKNFKVPLPYNRKFH